MRIGDLSIVTRLSIGFSLILALTFGLGYFAWRALGDMEGHVSAVDGEYFSLLRRATDMSHATTKAVGDFKDYFASCNPDRLNAGMGSIHTAASIGSEIESSITSNALLAPFHPPIVSLNATYDVFLKEIQAAMDAHFRVVEARQNTDAAVHEAGKLARLYILTHINPGGEGVHNHDAETHWRPLAGELADISSKAWDLRVALQQARGVRSLSDALVLEKQWDNVTRSLDSVLHQDPCPPCTRSLKQISAALHAVRTFTREFITAWKAEEKAVDLVHNTSGKLLQDMENLSNQVLDCVGSLAKNGRAIFSSSVRSMTLVTLLAVVLGIMLAFGLGLGITRPLRRCVDFAKDVAAGNLERTLELNRKDEIGSLAQSVNSMVHTLRQRIDQEAAMSKALLQEGTISNRALLLARAAPWYIEVGKRDRFVATQQLCRMMGEDDSQGDKEFSLHEWLGRVIAADPDTALRVGGAIYSVLDGKEDSADIIHMVQRAADGKTIWVRDMLEAVRDENGQRIMLVGLTQDITEYIHQQQALESASRAQSTFIANMSHEIRTPLNAVIGMGHLLRRTELNVQQRNYLEKIDSSSQLLLALVNDILDLSKIEAGEMHLEAIAFQLGLLLRKVGDIAEEVISAKGLRLRIRIDESVPSTVVGDPLRLQQVLTNLVNNACKFTSKGSITIMVDVARTGIKHDDVPAWPAHLSLCPQAIELRFTVRDTGLGMSEAQSAKLFRSFVQADVSITRRFGGTGLGLTICRHLCQLMGGDISVTSQPGCGSAFTFTVLCGSQPGTAPVLGEHDLQRDLTGTILALSDHPGHILLVEDNDINALIAKEMLEAMGHTVDVAENGAVALELLDTNAYNLVLMDLQMPVMDGVTASMKIRDQERFDELAVVAMTAHAMSTDREQCMEAGMDDHITKPLDPVLLRDMVERWISK